MEKEEMLEQTNEPENIETQTIEEIEEGIELTDTTDTEEIDEIETVEEKEEVITLTAKEIQEKIDSAVKNRLAREQRKFEKEMNEKLSKYQTTEKILNAGLGTKDIDEATQQLTEYYKERGINIPEPVKPGLTQREIEILAKVEAEELIEDGIDVMTSEANKLASKGYENLNAKEKVIFNTLAERLTFESKKTELVKNGVKADILDDKDFKAFADKFSSKASVLEIYNLYSKTKETKEKPKPIGSMTTTETNKVKDYYTPEEARRLTEKDLDDPQVMKAVEYSMTKWEQDKH